MTKRFRKEKIFYGLITLAIAIIIFLISNMTSFSIEYQQGLNLAVFYHFGIFFMFTFFLTLTLVNKKLNSKKIVIILLISLIYSLSDEFHQLFVIGRFCSVKDVLTDFVGSLFSVVLLKTIEELKIFLLIFRRKINKK